MKTNSKTVKLFGTTQPALWLVCLFAAGVYLAGCKPAPGAAAGGDITGIYALVSVNGNPVPATVAHEGTPLKVLSGTFTIKADGTCGTRTVFVPPNGTERTQEVSATYTRDGSRLRMKWQGAGITTGTVEGKTLTMENEGLVFLYRK